MGAVYEARQEPLERRVALKTLHADHAKSKEFIARLVNEAKVLSRLEHPSLVQISDFGHAADGTAYLVMGPSDRETSWFENSSADLLDLQS